MASKKLFKRRVWLNKDTELRAHVIAHVTVNTHKSGGGSIDSYVDIGDCNRNISLDINCYGYSGSKEFDKDYANNLAKVQKLIEVLQGVEGAMIEAKKIVDKHPPKKVAKRNKKD